MPKQSGLYQIRGKVGELSYYKQTGVKGGLFRSINQGLSSRVKTGAEYVNTRLNNAEFGQACRVASKLISYITPKYRPMILPFSQAKLAKDLLQIIKESAGNWGQRNISDVDGSKVAPFVSALSKNNFDDFGIVVSGGNDALQINGESAQFGEKLASIGADGCIVRAVLTDTWVGKYLSSAGAYVLTSAHSNVYEEDILSGGSAEISDAEYPSDPIAPTLQDGMRNVFVILMPYRKVNNVTHVLQEYCAFKAFAQIALGD